MATHPGHGHDFDNHGKSAQIRARLASPYVDCIIASDLTILGSSDEPDATEAGELAMVQYMIKVADEAKTTTALLAHLT